MHADEDAVPSSPGPEAAKETARATAVLTLAEPCSVAAVATASAARAAAQADEAVVRAGDAISVATEAATEAAANGEQQEAGEEAGEAADVANGPEASPAAAAALSALEQAARDVAAARAASSAAVEASSVARAAAALADSTDAPLPVAVDVSPGAALSPAVLARSLATRGLQVLAVSLPEGSFAAPGAGPGRLVAGERWYRFALPDGGGAALVRRRGPVGPGLGLVWPGGTLPADFVIVAAAAVRPELLGASPALLAVRLTIPGRTGRRVVVAAVPDARQAAYLAELRRLVARMGAGEGRAPDLVVLADFLDGPLLNRLELRRAGPHVAANCRLRVVPAADGAVRLRPGPSPSALGLAVVDGAPLRIGADGSRLPELLHDADARGVDLLALTRTGLGSGARPERLLDFRCFLGAAAAEPGHGLGAALLLRDSLGPGAERLPSPNPARALAVRIRHPGGRALLAVVAGDAGEDAQGRRALFRTVEALLGAAGPRDEVLLLGDFGARCAHADREGCRCARHGPDPASGAGRLLELAARFHLTPLATGVRVHQQHAHVLVPEDGAIEKRFLALEAGEEDGRMLVAGATSERPMVAAVVTVRPAAYRDPGELQLEDRWLGHTWRSSVAAIRHPHGWITLHPPAAPDAITVTVGADLGLAPRSQGRRRLAVWSTHVQSGHRRFVDLQSGLPAEEGRKFLAVNRLSAPPSTAWNAVVLLYRPSQVWAVGRDRCLRQDQRALFDPAAALLLLGLVSDGRLSWLKLDDGEAAPGGAEAQGAQAALVVVRAGCPLPRRPREARRAARAFARPGVRVSQGVVAVEADVRKREGDDGRWFLVERGAPLAHDLQAWSA